MHRDSTLSPQMYCQARDSQGHGEKGREVGENQSRLCSPFSFLDSISPQNSKEATTVASTTPVPSSTPAFSSPVTLDTVVKGN